MKRRARLSLARPDRTDARPVRLAWEGRGLGARGYHRWNLEPAGGGTRIVTEETQVGAAPSLLRALLTPALRRQHQRWLEGLARAGRHS